MMVREVIGREEGDGKRYDGNRCDWKGEGDGKMGTNNMRE